MRRGVGTERGVRLGSSEALIDVLPRGAVLKGASGMALASPRTIRQRPRL